MAEPSLELLQAMSQRVLDKLTEHDGDFHAIRERLTAIERHLAGVRRDAAFTVNVQAQVDRLGDRIGRIERRLDLTDASA